MTTALIAEDEPVLAAALAQSLSRLWPGLALLPAAANGMAAVELALRDRPDVLFLDIKMPGKTGLEAAQELAEEWPDAPGSPPFPLLVFVTAYDDYALQAFDQAAVDYVLKPVNDARLQKTVERLQRRLGERSASESELERVLTQLRTLAAPAGDARAMPVPPLQVIRAAVGNQVRMIPVADVLYFEAGDKYVRVVSADGESLIRTPLRELLAQLDGQQFWQIHRGTVVNVAAIAAAQRDESGKLRVRLRGREEMLVVSRVFAHLFRQM
ncbi:LytR/AlgR family response regulator transcription factor [Lacisediminimonas profundi]|uniref:LytR/AlgR family response regulator transcription factor n=1 Tax=Lacisediminimonas profundi TaxID=2603856 RepID=UPI00124AE7FD|nr:LytTR family DNA-binding domain-containing protein [Lacisediminimonas profundi]